MYLFITFFEIWACLCCDVIDFHFPSPKHGSGQQCCYDSTGAQVLTGDSIGGGTPDRAHDWGSPPYRDPPRVPGLSHWLYDVLSFYYCCLWSDHCHIYFRHRNSSGCTTYQPPRAGEKSHTVLDYRFRNTIAKYNEFTETWRDESVANTVH